MARERLGLGITLSRTVLDVAARSVAHRASLVITQAIWSPFRGVLSVKTGPEAAAVLLTTHWYWTLGPPLADTAVNATAMLLQTGFAVAEITTEGTTASLMARLLEVASAFTGHVTLLTIMQLTSSP